MIEKSRCGGAGCGSPELEFPFPIPEYRMVLPAPADVISDTEIEEMVEWMIEAMQAVISDEAEESAESFPEEWRVECGEGKQADLIEHPCEDCEYIDEDVCEECCDIDVVGNGCPHYILECDERESDHCEYRPKTSFYDSQVGGSHYKDKPRDVAEFCIANGYGFAEGNIIKYAARHAEKNGAEDVKKIIHYAQFILETVYGIGPDAD